MAELAMSPADRMLDPLARWVADPEKAAGLDHDIRAIRRNWTYLVRLSELGNNPEAIRSVKPEDLKGSLALAFLDADDEQKHEIHLELQRWALYFSDTLVETEGFIASIESARLRDPSSIAEIASMTQGLVDVADGMFNK